MFEDTNFINDLEKMNDFLALTKKEFLQTYSYLTEEEYDNTNKIYENIYHKDREVVDEVDR